MGIASHGTAAVITRSLYAVAMSSTARVLRVPSSITRAKRCEPTLTGRIQSALSTVADNGDYWQRPVI